MRPVKLFFTIIYCLVSLGLFAQSPKAIEADLLKSFKKISYWERKRSSDTTTAWSDSLEIANDAFGKKLQYYTGKFPATLDMKFSTFSDQPLSINQSTDGQFRIYSWDTLTGGTMHNFENVFQYKVGQKTRSILDTTTAEGENNVYSYPAVNQLTANNRTYYIASYYGVYSGKDRGEGIRIFSIENGNLIDAKIIKTGSGMHYKLYYDYDLFSIPKKMPDAGIHYDPLAKTITLPVISAGGRLTANKIIYKFTGQYFERVKN